MEYRELSAAITEEIKNCLLKTDPEQVRNAAELISGSARVFLAGAGRSGFEISAFTMRLMHLGFTAYRVGDVTTPAIKEGDLLVVASGSGETKSMLLLADTAKKKGAKVLLFTTSDTSSIASLADAKVVIHGKAAKSAATASQSIQPMSNLFVQSVCITFDIIIISLMEMNGLDESLMKDNHANLE